MRQIDEQRLRKMIRIAVDVAGSQQSFAASVGISESYLCDILKGRRPVADKILAWFGLERVVTYRRVDGGQL